LLILDLVIFDVRYFIVCLYRCDWRSNYQECRVKISLTSAWSFVFCAIFCRPLFVFLALLLCVLLITASSYPFGIDHIYDSVPIQDLDFLWHRHMLLSFFVFNDLRWELSCLFCWYWWNCWPSLLKSSIYNFCGFGHDFCENLYQVHTGIM
jgi:hypothetical protein